jgi:hypothetical protein
VGGIWDERSGSGTAGHKVGRYVAGEGEGRGVDVRISVPVACTGGGVIKLRREKGAKREAATSFTTRHAGA